MTITHESYPPHDIGHLDDIYQSVAALLGSIDAGDSRIAAALHDEKECAQCFRQAVLHVIELLPHCGTTADSAHLARRWHTECLQNGSVPGSAISDLVAL